MDKEILEKFRNLKPFKNDVVKNPWDPEVLGEKAFTEKEYQKMLPIIKNKILDMENYIGGREKPYRSKNT